MPQHVTALTPEAGDGLADGEVGAGGVGVHVAGVCDFGEGGGGDEVDLGVREGFELLAGETRISRVGGGNGGKGRLTLMPNFSARV